MALVVGLDWGTKCHALIALDAVSGDTLYEAEVPHQGADIMRVVAHLKALAHDESVCVGIERPDGVLVDVLCAHGIRVFAWNPRQTKAWRQVGSNSGAKDDRGDARAIADALRYNPTLFDEVEAPNAAIVLLRGVLSSLEDLTKDIIAQKNRLHAKLQSVLPSLWPKLNLDTDWSRQLLKVLLDSPQPWRMRNTTLSRLLGRSRSLDTETAKGLLKADRMMWSTATGTQGRELAKTLLALLESVLRARKELEAQRDAIIAKWVSTQSETTQHDVEIIRSMPGAGANLVATLVAYAWDAVAARDTERLRLSSGVAPVSVLTGGKRAAKGRDTQFRRACRPQLRQAMHHWARIAAQCDNYAKQRMTLFRDKGHTYARGLRQLGDGLLRVLCAALRNGTVYEPRLPAQ